MDDKLICFTEDEIIKPREIIIELMDLMAQKAYTDYSGGNMALRVRDKIYITQRHSAEKFRWKLRPDDIIMTDNNGNVLEGKKDKITREGALHFSILQKFPELNCTLHGNTFYSPLLLSAGIKVGAATEVAEYYNIKEIPATPEEVEMLSDEEINIVLNYFEELKQGKQALAVIFPRHGIIVAAKDHNEAFSLIDAIEINSKFILFRELLKTGLIVNDILKKAGDNVNRNSGSRVEFIRTNVATVEDIEEAHNTSIKEITISAKCIVTALAENRANELGVKIIRK
jgi:ribulose-5-phosphate 4-epimerase/fuculose-1-phosphate aldolase